jgi:hypothetical protein
MRKLGVAERRIASQFWGKMGDRTAAPVAPIEVTKNYKATEGCQTVASLEKTDRCVYGKTSTCRHNSWMTKLYTLLPKFVRDWFFWQPTRSYQFLASQ